MAITKHTGAKGSGETRGRNGPKGISESKEEIKREFSGS